MADPRKILGDVIRATRVAKGYSLRKFAGLADMSPTYLSQIEQGKVERPPTAERVSTIAKLLDQDPDEWIALAGRIPDDVAKIIADQPQAMPALLRAANGLTTEQLRDLTEQLLKQSGED